MNSGVKIASSENIKFIFPLCPIIFYVHHLILFYFTCTRIIDFKEFFISSSALIHHNYFLKFLSFIHFVYIYTYCKDCNMTIW